MATQVRKAGDCSIAASQVGPLRGRDHGADNALLDGALEQARDPGLGDVELGGDPHRVSDSQSTALLIGSSGYFEAPAPQ